MFGGHPTPWPSLQEGMGTAVLLVSVPTGSGPQEALIHSLVNEWMSGWEASGGFSSFTCSLSPGITRQCEGGPANWYEPLTCFYSETDPVWHPHRFLSLKVLSHLFTECHPHKPVRSVSLFTHLMGMPVAPWQSQRPPKVFQNVPSFHRPCHLCDHSQCPNRCYWGERLWGAQKGEGGWFAIASYTHPKKGETSLPNCRIWLQNWFHFCCGRCLHSGLYEFAYSVYKPTAKDALGKAKAGQVSKCCD